MTEHFWLGMTLIFLGGVFNGGFPVPMRFTRRWEWENTWLVFALVSVGIMPWVLAAAFVPHLAGVYQGAHRDALLLPLIFGLLWGTAQATFGVAIRLAGMAFAFAVVSGLGCLSGSLVPILVLHPGDLFHPRGLMLLVGMPILLLGLFLYAKAGQRRENEQRSASSSAGEASGKFVAGLAVCIFTGIFASSFNLGFAFGGEIVQRSLQHGATPLTSTYAVWAIVLGAGFIPNLIYCGYLLVRRRTLSLYLCSESLRNVLLAVMMAFLWLSAIYGYGVGATLVGRYGTSLGFTLFVAASILSGNFMGIFAGEWRATSPATTRLRTYGIIAVVISVVVLNLGGLF
jgi:L-rhamnose-H+ transport protein